MRFWKKIGIVADIKKTFLQVRVQPKERDVKRFLRLKDINASPMPSNIITYRFTRIPCGIAGSPFLLGATIKHHLENTNNNEQRTTNKHNLNRDIYVNNLITGADSKEDASHLY